MKAYSNEDVFFTSLREAGAEEWLNRQTILNADIGPATKRLNQYYMDTDGDVFNDLIYYHTDAFALKYTWKEWAYFLHRGCANDDSSVEFSDQDVELVHQVLYRFQKLCENHDLPTRNPFAFYRSFCNWIDAANPSEAVSVVVLFLYTASDRNFIFDSAVTSQFPSIFISRESIQLIKNFLPGFVHRTYSKTKVYPLLDLEPEKQARSIQMVEQQNRELQLMLPGRAEYGTYYEGVMIPAVKRQQQHIREALLATSGQSMQTADFSVIIKVCLKCFLWHLKSRVHLNLSSKKREALKMTIKRVERAFENTEELKGYEDVMHKVLSLTQNEPWKRCCILLLYRVMTRYRNDISHGQLPELKKSLILELDKPTATLKSTSDTARREYRANILLFQKLCFELRDFLSEKDLRMTQFMFEFTEPYSEERYASENVVSASPNSQFVADFIKSTSKDNTVKYIFADLVPLIHRIQGNMDITPFDLFPFYHWSISQDKAYKLLYSLDKDNGLAQVINRAAKKGRTQSLWGYISGHLNTFKKTKAKDYEKIRWKYYHKAFETSSGYGSGLPTYEWMFSILEISDYLLLQCPELQKLDTAFEGASDLLELAIHIFLLNDIKEWVLDDVKRVGKRIFYSQDLLEVVQEGDVREGVIEEDNLGVDVERVFIRGAAVFSPDKSKGAAAPRK